jgi:hypothetical protein
MCWGAFCTWFPVSDKVPRYRCIWQGAGAVGPANTVLTECVEVPFAPGSLCLIKSLDTGASDRVQGMWDRPTRCLAAYHLCEFLLRMAVFWVMAQCSLVDVYRRFRDTCCLHHQGDDGGRKYLWNVGKLLPDYTALQPRRQPSSYSPSWEPQILLFIMSS